MSDDRDVKHGRFSNRLEVWLERAIDRFANMEKIVWDISLQPMQSGEGHPVPSFVVIFWMPTGIQSQPVIQGSFVVLDPVGATEEFVESVVARFVNELRSARTKILSEAASEQSLEAARRLGDALKGSNGNGGLILP